MESRYGYMCTDKMRENWEIIERAVVQTECTYEYILRHN